MNVSTNSITLLDHQIKHFDNIKNCLVKYSRAIDASETGTGKTYVSVKLCLELNLIPWIICPKSIVSSWNRIIKQAGIKKFNIITYDQLIISKELLKKNNETNEYTWLFESYDKYKGKNKENYLFIYDEAHKCKNLKTNNSKILMSLSKFSVKILLLSATIIDKPLFFIPFGIVLKLFNTPVEGLEWITNTINNKSADPMLPIHNALFNKYASRMRIDDTIGVFKNNKI